MFGLGPATRTYVALGATDMRKGFDGLYGIVREIIDSQYPDQPIEGAALIVEVQDGGGWIDLGNRFCRVLPVLTERDFDEYLESPATLLRL